jgi:hypothetical protein
MTELLASAERQPVDNAAEFAELWMGRDALTALCGKLRARSRKNAAA